VWRRERRIMQQSFDFSLDGKIFATYQTASVWRLPRFPIFFIGCGFNDAHPSWNCGADFDRSLENIDTTPKSVDTSRYDTPESIVLGLSKNAADYYADFKGDDRWSAFIKHIDDYPSEQAQFESDHKADLFKQFSDFVHESAVETTGRGVIIEFIYEGNKAPPDDMEAALLAKPEQLVALRDAIATRFVQLAQVQVSASNKWFRLIATSLVALPRDAFSNMPDHEVKQLLDALHSSRGLAFFPKSLPPNDGRGPTHAGLLSRGTGESASKRIPLQGARTRYLPPWASRRTH
jgi:hypothetical protein